MAPRTSQLWEHYTQEEGTPHIARCKYCSKTISRGKEGTTKPNNGGMINHLQRMHQDAFTAYKESEDRTKKIDTKDETVRGTIPLFSLKKPRREAAVPRSGTCSIPVHIVQISVWSIIDLYNLISPDSLIKIIPDFQYR